MKVEAAGSSFAPMGVWREEGGDDREDKEDKQKISKYAVEKLIRLVSVRKL